MKSIFIILFISVISSGCTNEGKATKVLNQSGYKEIQMNGYGWFSCSEDDWFKTSFIAKAPNGDKVSGTVCSGLFKGNTIRLD